MRYDHGDSFPSDFEPNGFPFDSKSKEKLSPRSYPIQCERKWKYNFLSAQVSTGCHERHVYPKFIQLGIIFIFVVFLPAIHHHASVIEKTTIGEYSRRRY